MKIIQTTLKKSLLLSMVILLLLSLSPALAAKQKTNVSISNSELNEPVIFQKEILATDEGEKFQVGFVRIDFKKDFIEEENLPITFEIKVYAENGEVYIEFNPSVDVLTKMLKFTLLTIVVTYTILQRVKIFT